jgi:hypothetical protein
MSNEITQEFFEDFKSRLHNLRRGELVHQHITADAYVQVRRTVRVYGFTSDFSDNPVIVDTLNHDSFDTPDEWYESLEPEEKEVITEALAEDDEIFEDLSDHRKWETIDLLDQYDVVRWNTKEEILSTHMTMESALTFIERHKHNYPSAYTYVESAYRMPEYNLIMNAILDGKIGFINPEEKP